MDCIFLLKITKYLNGQKYKTQQYVASKKHTHL
jgi:hypothetical protein